MHPEPQDVANSKIKPLNITDSGSRIKISNELLKLLGWGEYSDEFDCWGVFRNYGEILCAPEMLLNEEGKHPFDDILDLLSTTVDMSNITFEDIPSAKVISAPYRIIKFGCTWNKTNDQLNLKLGVNVLNRLDWTRDKPTKVYPITYGKILILLSENRFLQIQNEALL